MNLGRFLNATLKPLGLEIRRTAGAKYWDKSFSTWIRKAQEQSRDPNDVADEAWGDVRHLVDKYYVPYLAFDKTVLELGPGSGRITRHLIERCKTLIVVDYSSFVTRWITDYLAAKGKNNFRVFQVSDCDLAPVPDRTVDVIVSDGVFHHMDLDDFYRYFVAFKRVLVPGGVVAINFVNFMAPEGYKYFRSRVGPSNRHDVFRWYHPEMVAALARNIGFEQIEVHNERVLAGDFVTYLTCRNPQ